MSMAPRPRTLLPHLLSVALLVVPLTGGPVDRATHAVADISPQVWDELETEGEADVLLVLRERADLGGAALLKGQDGASGRGGRPGPAKNQISQGH